MAGTVQLIDAVPPRSVVDLSTDPAVTLKQRAGLGFSAFSFNTRQPPFEDVRVRRAFVRAIEAETVLRVAYFGQGVAAAGPITPSVSWACDESLKASKAGPAAAQQMLSDTGISLPVAVTLTITNAPLQVRVAEIIQTQAAQAGIAVTLEQLDPTSLITFCARASLICAFLRGRDSRTRMATCSAGSPKAGRKTFPAMMTPMSRRCCKPQRPRVIRPVVPRCTAKFRCGLHKICRCCSWPSRKRSGHRTRPLPGTDMRTARSGCGLPTSPRPKMPCKGPPQVRVAISGKWCRTW